jgi:hypothetical protein
MRVFMDSMLLLLSMSHAKFYPVPGIFSSAVDENWHFNKIAQVENAQKMVKMNFSRSHNFHLGDWIGA